MLASEANFSKSFLRKDFKWKYKLNVSNKEKHVNLLSTLHLLFLLCFRQKKKIIKNDSRAQTLTSSDPAPSNQGKVD